VLGGRTSVVGGGLGRDQSASEVEMIQKDSAKRWARRLRACCAAQVATTVQIDIDTENYQQKTGPPSTSRLREVVIVQVKATSDITRLERSSRGEVRSAQRQCPLSTTQHPAARQFLYW
jgi:hypothetical protein